MTYLEQVRLFASGSLNGRVEGILLGVVGHLVDLVEEVDVGLVDGGQIIGQAGECVERLLLCVASGPAGDGDVVEGGSLEDGLALLHSLGSG